MVARSIRVVALLVVLVLAACAPSPSPEPPAPSTRPAITPGLELDRLLKVGFLIVDGVYNTELTAPLDLFHHTVFHTDPLPGMEVFTVSPDGAQVTSFEGLRIVPDYSFADVPPIDILVVPSAEGSMDKDLENQAMMDWVREVGSEASYVISLCDGAFVLAAAGLLDGHACTTFPGDQDRFAETFPHLDMRREVSFVHDGRMITSQGGAKSFDPAMHLIDVLYGEEVAKGVARGLIIEWPPVEVRSLIVSADS